MAATVAKEMRSEPPYERQNIFVERRKSSRRAAPVKEVAPAVPQSNRSELPRAASYTYIPSLRKGHFPSDSVVTRYTEHDLNSHAEDAAEDSTPDSSGWTTPEEHRPDSEVGAERERHLVLELHKSTKVAPHTARDGERSSEESSLSARPSLESSRSKSTAATTPSSHTPRASVTSNFSRKLARKSWSGSNTPTPDTSRSPSPPKKQPALPREVVSENDLPTVPQQVKQSRRKSLIRRKTTSKPSRSEKAPDTPQSSDNEQPGSEQSLTRKPSLFRRTSRPVSGLFRSSTFEGGDRTDKDSQRRPEVPPVPRPYLLQSFSTDRLPGHNPDSQNIIPPSPRPLTSHKSGGLTIARKKDELWNHFRTLEADFTKFYAKSSTFKVNVVRSSLLPFLRAYANHSSNRNLRVEDLDRRANIFNKWWTGLLEMLHGRNNQSLTGTDRPAILDAIAGIMERPEWRLSPSPFCPLNLRTKGTSLPKSQSTASFSSEQSDFLAESVHHNVRNIFVQNLSAQMAFVVDKMSFRHASASLVTFCGKACAYAFTFVPGMADILGRLWDLQMDTLRRVLSEAGIGKFDNLTNTCENIMTGFPPALQQLGFVSLTKYMRTLRTPPPLPLSFGNIHWWGHWLQRWTGRESDLFYVFVKHFHILTTDFLPADTTRDERICAPGMLLVQAQLLTNLDATIHRDANRAQHDAAATNASPTFDDVFADPDAYSPALPPQPVNAVRVMAENRTVMLIRDFLAERGVQHPLSRQLFAESINNCLQTATRGTSLFDHGACYTLLDFLEEALVLLIRFEHVNECEREIVNPKFWKEVFVKMLQSQNTVTSIRLFAFLYTVWNTIICEPDRKWDLSIEFLLEPDMFDSMFNHWCPMVRAYYMRLLCWRIGRFDGEPAAGDIEILETLLARLQTTWCHYLYLREQADRDNSVLPQTSPSNPAPGRRLLIVRTDTQANSDALLSFDSIMAPEAQAPPAVSKRVSMMSTFGDIDSRTELAREISDPETETRGRGIGGFFKKMLSSSKSRSSSRETSTRARAPSTLSNASAPASTTRSDTSLPNGGLTRSATEDTPSTKAAPAAAAVPPRPQPTPHQTHRNFSFKFSLEHQPNNGKALPPMRLTPPRLPLPAQQYLHAHSADLTPLHALQPLQPPCREHATYCGRALAEWQIMLGECQSFFDRRRGEGVPENRFVETPSLGVEAFRRPG